MSVISRGLMPRTRIDEATSGMDAFSTGVGLDNVLRMAELFDGPDPRPS